MTALAQFAAFLGVGCVNTAIDVGLFNLAARRPFHLPWVMASLFSTTVAMSFSFTMNVLLVFRPNGDLVSRAAQFLLVTAFSAYVIQSAVLFLARRASRRSSRPAFEVLERNKAKLLAVTAGILWNFLWYKFMVFA